MLETLVGIFEYMIKRLFFWCPQHFSMAMGYSHQHSPKLLTNWTNKIKIIDLNKTNIIKSHGVWKYSESKIFRMRNLKHQKECLKHISALRTTFLVFNFTDNHIYMSLDMIVTSKCRYGRVPVILAAPGQKMVNLSYRDGVISECHEPDWLVAGGAAPGVKRWKSRGEEHSLEGNRCWWLGSRDVFAQPVLSPVRQEVWLHNFIS